MDSNRKQDGSLVHDPHTALSNPTAAKQLAADRAGLVARGLVEIAQSAYEQAHEYLEQERWDEAMRLLQIAAAHEHTLAQVDLGEMYLAGEVVPEDSNEANKWFQRAAENGNAEAQYIYSLSFDEGSPDEEKWLRLAAEQGHEQAQNNLGLMYEYGKGVPQNYEKAIRWYLPAAERGQAWAQSSLGRLYENSDDQFQDFGEAVKWYLLAANQGFSIAELNLARMYESGRGVQKNIEEANKWRQIAERSFEEKILEAVVFSPRPLKN